MVRSGRGGDVDVVIHRAHDGHDGHVHDLPGRGAARRRGARDDRLTEEVRRRDNTGVGVGTHRGLVRARGAERDGRRAGSREVRGRTRDHLVFFQILLPLAYIQRAGRHSARLCVSPAQFGLTLDQFQYDLYMSPNPHLVRPDRETMVRLTSEMNDRQISRLWLHQSRHRQVARLLRDTEITAAIRRKHRQVEHQPRLLCRDRHAREGLHPRVPHSRWSRQPDR